MFSGKRACCNACRRIVGAPLGTVRFEKNDYVALMKVNLDYMFSLDPDRLLYHFRRIAGLDTGRAQEYGGWISSASGGAGHFEAHYISALAMASRTPNYERNGERITGRLLYLLTELEKCQTAFAKKDPENAGYLGALGIGVYDALEVIGKGQGSCAADGSYVWVPWYNYHKILEALYQTAVLVTDEMLRSMARRMLMAAAYWAWRRVHVLSDRVRENMLKTEYGGMSEILYKVYGMTRDIRFFEAARFFEEKPLLDQMYHHTDCFNGLHANTTIPKILGCAAAYEVTNDEYYKTICLNGFEMILKRTYANGGTGREEFWRESDMLQPANDTAETCCSYNLLKLADYLFRWTGNRKYADYFENAYTNYILASMAPESGLKTYFLNTAFGHYKIYHTQERSFWCCAGTGMESFAKLPYGIYYFTRDTIYVNMFYPSTLFWKKGISLTQSGNILPDQEAKITVHGNGRFGLALRLPDWVQQDIEISVNCEKIQADFIRGYYFIAREWKDGDRLKYSLSFALRFEKSRGDKNKYSIHYGPLLLAADLGQDDISDIQESQITYGSDYRGCVIDRIKLAGNSLEKNAVLSVDSDGSLFVKLHTLNQGVLIFRPLNRIFHARYGIYFEIDNLS